MAKTKTKPIRIQSAKTIAELRTIGKDIEGIVNNGVRGMASQAADQAKKTLMDFPEPTYTTQQLSPEDAAKEVGVRYDKTTKTAYVYAPKNAANRNAMYFLEYGAGLESRQRDHTEDVWIYKIKDGESDIHKIPETDDADKEKGIIRHAYNIYAKAKRESGYTFEPVKFKNFNGTWYGINRASRPVRYMAAAKLYIRSNARQKIANQINYYLQRRSNRRQRIVEEE